jgi:hypothetical protein
MHQHLATCAHQVLEKISAGSAGARPVQPPLPRLIKERAERKAGYETAKKDITKWQPIIKVGGVWRGSNGAGSGVDQGWKGDQGSGMRDHHKEQQCT